MDFIVKPQMVTLTSCHMVHLKLTADCRPYNSKILWTQQR